MLLTSDGRVKLADLGVAAQLGNSMSKRGTMIGTPHWMAPETVGQNEQYDFKVDIWGVAILAMELAQGEAPFAGIKNLYNVCPYRAPMPHASKCMRRPIAMMDQTHLQSGAYAICRMYTPGADEHPRRRAPHARAHDGRL